MSNGNYNTENHSNQIPPPKTSLQFDIVQQINFACAQNNIEIIKEIVIDNQTDEVLNDISISLRAQPEAIRPVEWRVDCVEPQEAYKLDRANISFNNEYLKKLNEGEVGEIELRMEAPGHEPIIEICKINLLPPNQWIGLGKVDQILTAFILPNDPAVDKVLRDASTILREYGLVDKMNGYERDDREDVYVLASAIWSAFTALTLTNLQSPISFDSNGQRIRLPSEIVESKLASKLDITLFLAAAYEKAGLNTAVLFSKGHSWAGFWTENRGFGHLTEPDVVVVRKAVQACQFIPIETELLTRYPPVNFNQAVKEGKFRIKEKFDPKFIVAVDVARCRATGIKPLSSHNGNNPHGEDENGHDPVPLDWPNITFPPNDNDEIPTTPKGRIDRWQRKLLDLTLRNRLLNFRDTKQTLQFRCLSVGAVENRLKSGKKLKTFSLADADLEGTRILTEAEKQEIEENLIRREFESNNGIAVEKLTGKDIKTRLTNIQRLAKRDIQEGGTNTLFLAAGSLRWKKNEDDSKRYEAPIVLIPVKLERGSINSPFYISLHEDEIRVNLTLLEYLKRDFAINIPELENELHGGSDGDESVFKTVFEIMRQKVLNIHDFEVLEEKLALSTFSFSKYLMWKDLVDRRDQLENNRLVKHLLDGTLLTNGNNSSNFNFGRLDLDRNYHPKDILTPLPADSSQLAAVVAASQGLDFIIIGPPGTGKSQTITNIISNCLGSGKTVLFVSEKLAALNVVHRRLVAKGFRKIVLELHSNKTDRKSVINQLVRGWELSIPDCGEEWIKVTEELKVTREKLNDYVDVLHSKGTQGFSVFEAISLIAEKDAICELSFASKDAHDKESYKNLEKLADDLSKTYTEVCKGTQFHLIEQNQWSNQWQNSIKVATDSFRTALLDLKQTEKNFADVLGLSSNINLQNERRNKLLALAPRAENSAHDISPILEIPIDRLNFLENKFTMDYKKLVASSAATQANYHIDEVRRMPVEQIDRDWREAQTRMWPFSNLAKSKVRKLLQTYAKNGVSDPEIDIKALFQIQKLDSEIQDNPLKSIATLNGEIKIDRLTESVHQAIEFKRSLENLKVEIEDDNRFRSASSDLASTLSSSVVMKSLKTYINSEKTVKDKSKEFKLLGGKVPIKYSADKLILELEKVEKRYLRLKDWTKWVEISRKCEKSGLKPLVEALENGEIKDSDAVREFKCAYAKWWLPRAIDSCEQLRDFVGWQRENLIDAFRKIDEEVMSMAQLEVQRRVTHNLPAKDELPKDSELGVLRHQMNLRHPSISVRNLIGELPNTFGKLAPCVLMSPLSIAQYLPAGHAIFDVVIFDEASQITTWDAVGAIARGRQTIIAGDPKQLPPTNFFERIYTDDEDVSEIEQDMPSILDEVSAAGVPEKMLNWHYRSRDESLITFSNRQYYDNKLVTFPAPSSNSLAIKFHKVNGTYARGKGRFNQKEAKAVVRAVKERLKEWLKLCESERPTLGVITFNSQQQKLILDLLDNYRRNNEELEWYFGDEREEPVIVKNLENIQGDERDIILFSVTFGPGDDGSIAMNFGAINPPGGERRLNVAITRARKEFHVFSSIHSDQVDLNRTRSKGVSDLKKFLDYAERGPVALRSHDQGSHGPAENIFEEAVASAVRAKGWEIRTQIGESGFRIDLGVIHPDFAGRYIAGIECDGATYHSSATARDRDRVRQSILEGLGWTIFRVWSTDWFHDQHSITSKLDKALNDLLEKDRNAKKTFEETVANALQAKGWKIHKQVVESDFCIDLGVVHPDFAERYIAGIECDGSTNDSSNSVHDWDRVSQSKLEGLGWTILRVWSVDWFHDQHSVTSKLDKALNDLLEKDRNKETDPNTTSPDEPKKVEDEESKCPEEVKPSNFYETKYSKTLKKQVKWIVDQEWPVAFEHLARKVAQLHGHSTIFQPFFARLCPRNLSISLSSGQRMAFPIRIEQLLVGQHAAQHLAQTITERPRRHRPWLCPRALSAWYFALLVGSFCMEVRAQWYKASANIVLHPSRRTT